ncbi:5'-nucleotidase SurE [Bienertia sinuspersici]
MVSNYSFSCKYGKEKSKKVGSVGASSNEHIEIFEPQVPEYERLRMLRIKQNESIMQSLGLEERAKSCMAQFHISK